jgi:hypothetical protein
VGCNVGIPNFGFVLRNSYGFRIANSLDAVFAWVINGRKVGIPYKCPPQRQIADNSSQATYRADANHRPLIGAALFGFLGLRMLPRRVS